MREKECVHIIIACRCWRVFVGVRCTIDRKKILGGMPRLGWDPKYTVASEACIANPTLGTVHAKIIICLLGANWNGGSSIAIPLDRANSLGGWTVNRVKITIVDGRIQN